MNQRLPKEEMIRKKETFRKLVRQGKTWQGRFFRCHFLFREGRKTGFSIPKRLGNAVQRNRMKRLLRENYRQIRHQFQDTQLVFVAKPDIRGVSYWDIQKEFQNLLRFIGKRP